MGKSCLHTYGHSQKERTLPTLLVKMNPGMVLMHFPTVIPTWQGCSASLQVVLIKTLLFWSDVL